MNHKNKILTSVNNVYREKNPSSHIKINKKNIENLYQIKRKFLIEKLKLPPKIFKNTELLDLGCGTGQNTIHYDWAGAKCTLVEYDKYSFLKAKDLFKNFAKNKFNILRSDLFKFKSNKKFDFVITNGVAHHTYDVLKNIKLAIKYLKKDGFLILGIGETNGFFQRHFQRYILYSLSFDHNEIYKLSKLFFYENLNRAKKFGGRSIDEIIYDTYLNPKINTLSFHQIKNFLKKNKVDLYSFDEDIFDFRKVYGFNKSYFGALKKNKNEENNFLINSIVNFNYHGKKDDTLNKNYKVLKNILNIQSKLTDKMNDQSIDTFKKLDVEKLIKHLGSENNKLSKIEIINTKNNIKFLEEILEILNILKHKNKNIKIKKLKKAIENNKFLFKGFNGKGMNFFVGMKK